MNGFTMISSFALSAELGGAFSAERWAYAGKMTLLGMGAIFSVLAILWAVLAVFKLIFVGKSPKAPKPQTKKQSSNGEISDDVLPSVITAGGLAYEEDKARNDTAMVAVLTAAVAAYRDQEGSSESFRVVSFKRVGGGHAWNAKK